MAVWSVEDRLEVELEGITQAGIRLVGGDVAVTAGEGPARLEVVWLNGAAVEVRHEDGELRIAQPEWSGPGWRRTIESLFVTDEPFERFSFGWIGRLFGFRQHATVNLVLPPEAALDVITVSAPVLVSGLHGPARARTVSGDVTLAGLAGEADAKTVSGRIDASGLSGEVRASTVAGSVSIAGSTARALAVKTVSGSIALDLDVDPKAVYDVASVSGDVGVRLSPGAGLLVEASSISGRLESDFGLRWESERPGGRRLREAIGSGEARLYLRTVSGRLRLIQQQAAA